MIDFATSPDTALISRTDARREMLGGMSRSTEWRLIRAGVLPEPIRLGHRSHFWRLGDLRRVLAEMGA